MPPPDAGLRYRDAGVDIDAGNRAKQGIASLVRSTAIPGVLSEVGSFGGLFRLPDGLREPVLVASTDGVGTKLKVAFLAERHDTVGEDLVNHCVNDILVQGARPLFFLDYLGLGRVDGATVHAVVGGIARGCRGNGCALLGGETAEMPDFYAPGEYDLAGTIVGVVEQGRLLDGSAVRAGDALVGLPASGLHTNGYSLARRIVFERLGLGVEDPFPGEAASVADVLLRVHRSYLALLLPLLHAGLVHGLAHITGGGITENLPRILPAGLHARVEVGSWPVPPLFEVLRDAGRVAADEMLRVFNMGVGMVAVVPAAEVDAVLRAAREAGDDAWLLGEVATGEGGVVYA